MVKQFLHFHHIQLIGGLGLYGERLFWLTVWRCGDGQVRCGHRLLQVHTEIYVLSLLGHIGQCNSEVFARVSDIQQHLRGQDLLYRGHRNDYILSKRSQHGNAQQKESGY